MCYLILAYPLVEPLLLIEKCFLEYMERRKLVFQVSFSPFFILTRSACLFILSFLFLSSYLFLLQLYHRNHQVIPLSTVVSLRK